jgi:hypothetical protein
MRDKMLLGVGMAAVLALGGVAGCAVTDTLERGPDAGAAATELRADTLADALLVCETAEDVQGCRDAAYAVPWTDTPECADDDGTGGPCIWVANRRGNGQGQSFLVDNYGRVVMLED